MSLKTLEGMGAFVSDVPVEREITFKLDGPEELKATIFVKKFSMGEYEGLSAEKDDKYGKSALVISKGILLDGNERIPIEKAYRLHKGIATAMLAAFGEVNGGKN